MCLEGARAVRSVLSEAPEAEIAVMIVWIRMLAADSIEAAVASALNFRDERARQFYDPARRAGKAIADSVGAPGELGWDMYLFYGRGQIWRAKPPPARIWVHQLKPSAWADPARFRAGPDLVRTLRDGVRAEQSG